MSERARQDTVESPAGVVARWRLIVAALGAPETLEALPQEVLEGLVGSVEAESLAPRLADAMARAGVLDRVPRAVRERLVQQERRARVGAALQLEVLGSVLRLLRGRGLDPMPVKGAHLASRFYSSPHLRQMADLDLLFADLGEGERAFELLAGEGFVARGELRSGDPWMWSRHLPELEAPRLGVVVEIHGGLVYAPRDRRHAMERALLESPETVEIAGTEVHVLRPEAAVVAALAHELVRHSEMRPRLQALLDVATILAREGAHFDWAVLADLARTSGFAQAVGLGLAMMQDVGLLPAAGPWAPLADREAWRRTRDELLAGRGGRELTRRELEAAVSTGGLGAGLGRAWVMLFPRPAFMRERYPERAAWPLPLLYPYRWLVQLGKLAAFVKR